MILFTSRHTCTHAHIFTFYHFILELNWIVCVCGHLFGKPKKLNKPHIFLVCIIHIIWWWKVLFTEQYDVVQWWFNREKKIARKYVCNCAKWCFLFHFHFLTHTYSLLIYLYAAFTCFFLQGFSLTKVARSFWFVGKYVWFRNVANQRENEFQVGKPSGSCILTFCVWMSWLLAIFSLLSTPIHVLITLCGEQLWQYMRCNKNKNKNTFCTFRNSWQHKRNRWNQQSCVIFLRLPIAFCHHYDRLIFYSVPGVVTVLLNFSWHYLQCTYVICHFVSFYHWMRWFLYFFFTLYTTVICFLAICWRF